MLIIVPYGIRHLGELEHVKSFPFENEALIVLIWIFTIRAIFRNKWGMDNKEKEYKKFRVLKVYHCWEQWKGLTLLKHSHILINMWNILQKM